MVTGRKLKLVVWALGVVATVLGLGLLPATSMAASCTVTVTTLTGQTLVFQLPVGAPISSLNLTVPIKSVSESCPQSTTTPTTTTSASSPQSTTTTGTTNPPSTTRTPTPSTPSSSTGASHKSSPSTSARGSLKTGAHKGTATAPSTSGPGQAQPSSHHGATSAPATKPSTKPTTSTPKPAPIVAPNGVPTPANPTFSFALPGPAPIGVPNFFIDSFQIPPFLLPIYQAAGTEYDVPWQILAAINEIETDYGRNLSVSSAGAVGWMQFLPSTWQRYGLDVTNNGFADPYNPVDAIFTAARYLHAAGASKSLSGAIYAYNHATWYVQSVLLRAQLIGGLPSKFLNAITGLVEGHFPVAAPAKYADSAVITKAKTRVKGSNAAVAIGSDPNSHVVHIFAKQGSPVIAVNDGKIVGIGHTKSLGNYIELQDSSGNVFTYAQLGSVPKLYPVPKPVKVSARQIAKELSQASQPSAPKPIAPATAGTQVHTRPATKPASSKTSATPISLPILPATSSKTAAPSTPSAATGTAPAASSSQVSITAPLVKERLFANPSRAASYAAGGDLQIKAQAPQLGSFQNYFSDVLHLGKNQYTLEPLKKGALVVAGTILGRLGAGTPKLASHVDFMIRPAGKGAPYIDPKPILDGWKLLEATAVYRAAKIDPFIGKNAKNPTIGQILLMSKEQLTTLVLSDPHVRIYACGRRDVEAGLIDRRILAAIEFLSASSLYPTISGLDCGHSANGSTGVDAAGVTGASMDISQINNIPIKGNQGPGSVTDLTIRRLLTLQGAMKPDEIVSTMSYKGNSNTIALPDHANRIEVSYTDLFGESKKLDQEIKSILQPSQWAQLINRISQIPEPVVPIAPSNYAIKVPGGG